MHGSEQESSRVDSGHVSNGSSRSTRNETPGKSVGSDSYMKLMGEDIEDEQDEHDRDLAAEMLRQAKSQEAATILPQNLLQDPAVKVESGQLDVELTPTKRKRGRPRKSEALPKKKVEADLTPRRSARREVVQKKREEMLKLEEERRIEEESKNKRSPRKASQLLADPSDSDDSDDFEDLDEEETPKKSLKKTKSPVKRQLLASPSPLSERRTKKGRPSKQEKVTKKVFSIFHMDDLDMLPQSTATSPVKADATDKKVSNKISLNFDNKGQSKFSSTPVISGIKKPVEEAKDTEVVTKFVPMPVPKLDEDGNMLDKGFLQNHLADVSVQFDQSARLTDERAYFLEGSEGYFEQHSLRFRPSASTLASNAPQIDYEEFIPYIKLGELVYKKEKDALQKLHEGLYHQWCFELSQGFSLNFFGVGSKASFIMDFVESYFMKWYQETILDDDAPPAVMVINGYNPATKLKTIIHDLVSLLVTPEERKQQNLRMPKHVSEAMPFLMSYIKRNTKRSSCNGVVKATLVLVIHNIDGDAFRDTRSQNYLSQLASLPNVWLLASTDNVNLSLLWDLYRFKNFNFLWHDVTTYSLYAVEMSFRDVLSMGKSKKFVGSKGAQFVLTSLTPNARSLYQILLQLQVEKLKDASTSQAGRTGLRGNTNTGLELRVLYETCVDKFVASNEINFKTMLGEFVEHKMCVLSKNPRGAEIVYVPFTFDEMEKLLEGEF